MGGKAGNASPMLTRERRRWERVVARVIAGARRDLKVSQQQLADRAGGLPFGTGCFLGRRCILPKAESA